MSHFFWKEIPYLFLHIEKIHDLNYMSIKENPSTVDYFLSKNISAYVLKS